MFWSTPVISLAIIPMLFKFAGFKSDFLIIVELISVWKRLNEFEARLEKNISLETVK